MDQNWGPAVQVVINNGHHSQALAHSQHPPGMSQRRERPLFVEEALQYSPMSSAPVFGLG
jgi:cohesin loading factor subunit SCC2